MTGEGQRSSFEVTGDRLALKANSSLGQKSAGVAKLSPALAVSTGEAAKMAGANAVPAPASYYGGPTADGIATWTDASDESRTITNTLLRNDDLPEKALRPSVEVGAEVVQISEHRRLFLLTNQMNLNGILSSRILAPRESFHKYYADLLELSPGWVPLLTIPPPAQLIERVVREHGSGAAVLLELSTSVLNGRELGSPVTYIRAAKFLDVVAIHFREEKSLREHQAREYSNVRPHDELLRVSPQLFEAASEDGFAIGIPPRGSSIDWLRIDRARGAVNGLLAAGDSGEGLAVAAGVLGAQLIPPGAVLPPWLTWDAMAGSVPVRVPATENEAERADRLIFHGAYRILGQRDRTVSWRPSEVLEAVAGEIAAKQPSSRVRKLVDWNLQHVGQIVNVERDFEPFRNPGTPYVAAKSLLMVLLRPDLGQLLDWPVQESGADPTTRAGAAVLAGQLRGLARESVKLRNVALDDLTAAFAVKTANGVTGSLGQAEFAASVARTELRLDGREIRTAPPLGQIPS
ncbi:hypothetical protein ACIPY3_19330 [Paenarthrobacter sp. NPDC089714]|uniref:hypothetical protein n=1 Tax=Paenarthrobacter sp. NPDC089714 TaxID=3364377 RepID=UPI0037F25C63